MSLKEMIMEKLALKPGKKHASSNIAKATKDFAKSNAPQFKGKSKAKRHQMAVAAGLEASRKRVGEAVTYKGQKGIIKAVISENLFQVDFGKGKSVAVRASSLDRKQSLTESAFVTPIMGTDRHWADEFDTRPSMSKYGFDLTAEDLGLTNIREDDGKPWEKNGSDDDSDDSGTVPENSSRDGDSPSASTANSGNDMPKGESKPLSTIPGDSGSGEPSKFKSVEMPADAPDHVSAEMQDGAAGAREPEMGSGKGSSFDSPTPFRAKGASGLESNEGDGEGKLPKKAEKTTESKKDCPKCKGKGCPKCEKKNSRIDEAPPPFTDSNDTPEQPDPYGDWPSAPGQTVESGGDAGGTISISVAALLRILEEVGEKSPSDDVLHLIADSLASCCGSEGGTIDVGNLDEVLSQMRSEAHGEPSGEPGDDGDGAEPTTAADGPEHQGKERVMDGPDFGHAAAEAGLSSHSGMRAMDAYDDIGRTKMQIQQPNRKLGEGPSIPMPPKPKPPMPGGAMEVGDEGMDMAGSPSGMIDSGQNQAGWDLSGPAASGMDQFGRDERPMESIDDEIKTLKRRSGLKYW